MDTVDGYAPRSVLGPAAVVLAERVPVIPGQPVTVTVDVSGAATLTVVFRNGTGGVVSVQTRGASGTRAASLVYGSERSSDGAHGRYRSVGAYPGCTTAGHVDDGCASVGAGPWCRTGDHPVWVDGPSRN